MNLAMWERGLVERGRVGHLGLLDDEGRPRVLPVTYALAGDAVWSAVDHKPKRRPGAELARVRWLRARPAATLTVDFYDDDWDRLAWVQLVGRVTVHDSGAAGVLEALAAKYEPYRERPPAGPFLELSVDRASSWRAREIQGE